MSEPTTSTERLRRIEAVTDTALAHLDVEGLLDELLQRICDLLEVDSAAVLLLDEDSNELVPAAARGIEDEIRHGTRIPVGQGFAGGIATRVRPAVIEHVDETNVLSPVLREQGIHSLLGAPLVVSGRLTGVLHVGTREYRRFDEGDLHLIQMVADRVALAAEARRSNVERAAASALQRSLLPTHLPAIPGLELAARYLPGDVGGVGGDWYDVFPLDEGRIGIAIGDVVGRGLQAATVMGRLRSALRAYALETPDPADVLERLDRKAQHFEAGQMTTVLYLVIEAGVSQVTLSSAGHLLPLRATLSGVVDTIEAPVDPPLGVMHKVQRNSTSIILPEGAALCLFTDGLVERRDVPLTEALDKLSTVVSAAAPNSVCEAVLTAMLGDRTAPDDVAVLALRRTKGRHESAAEHSGDREMSSTERNRGPAAAARRSTKAARSSRSRMGS